MYRHKEQHSPFIDLLAGFLIDIALHPMARFEKFFLGVGNETFLTILAHTIGALRKSCGGLVLSI